MLMMLLIDDLVNALKRNTKLAGEPFKRFATGIAFANELVSFRF